MTTQDKRKQLMLERIEKRRKEAKRRKFRKRVAAIISVISISGASLGAVYTASAKEITITEINEFEGINETKTITTRVDNVEEFLAECGVSVGDADKLSRSTDEEINDNESITITRGKKITIKSESGEQEVNITKADITDALVEAGYIPGEDDEISTDGEVLDDGSRIELVSVSSAKEIVNTSVEFETKYIEDSTLDEGETKVVTEGQAGNIETVYNVTYKDGAEYSREVVSEKMTVEPVAKVIAKGTKKKEVKVTPPATKGSMPSSDTGNTINGMKYKKKITMEATAYSTSPSENGGYTVSAMGNPLGFGIVAVDPSIVPLGSKVYVESVDGSWTYGVASAEDTGGAIKGKRIDLCYGGSVSEVNKFGRRSCNVYILE